MRCAAHVLPPFPSRFKDFGDRAQVGMLLELMAAGSERVERSSCAEATTGTTSASSGRVMHRLCSSSGPCNEFGDGNSCTGGDALVQFLQKAKVDLPFGHEPSTLCHVAYMSLVDFCLLPFHRAPVGML
jgi:hypothetical protein